MLNTFTQSGGAQVYIFCATWPLATLEVTESELQLKCGWMRWTFPKDQITRLSECGLFSSGLRIQHSIKRYAKYIVFRTFNFPNLKKALEQRGYTVYDRMA